ncbi:MAG: hypothetical protein E7242_05485 [Lachnospiraceae bacterium]|nr:hypothetical protein [Lachnospiraceae bacterium]
MKLFSFIKDLITKSLVSKILTVIILCGIAASVVIPVAIKNNASDMVVAEVKEEQENKSFTSEISIPISEPETTTTIEAETLNNTTGNTASEYFSGDESTSNSEFVRQEGYVPPNQRLDGHTYHNGYDVTGRERDVIDLADYVKAYSPRGPEMYYMMSGAELNNVLPNNPGCEERRAADLAFYEDWYRNPKPQFYENGEQMYMANGEPYLFYCGIPGAPANYRYCWGYWDLGDEAVVWPDAIYWYDEATDTLYADRTMA